MADAMIRPAAAIRQATTQARGPRPVATAVAGTPKAKFITDAMPRPRIIAACTMRSGTTRAAAWGSLSSSGLCGTVKGARSVRIASRRHHKPQAASPACDAVHTAPAQFAYKRNAPGTRRRAAT